MTALPARYRFSVDEYEQMGRAGILGEDDRVELIGGEVVEMAPIGPGHAAGVLRVNRILGSLFATDAHVSPQNPLRLDPHSEPQPDLMLLRPRADYYASAHPTPTDVLLLVEVADTSLAYDGDLKVRLYGRAGVSEVWLVSLPERTVTAYRDPTPAGYGLARELRPGDRIAPLAFPDRELAVADLLG